MKVEILYGDIANLFGEMGHIRFIKKTWKNHEIYETPFGSRPRFADEDVDFIFLGSMSESTLERVIDELMPYKERLWELIEKDKLFLLTGNALEAFCQKVNDKEGLGFFDLKIKDKMLERISGLFLGTYNNLEVTGFQVQFARLFGEKDLGWFKVERGVGRGDKEMIEGLHYRNLYGSHLMGPLLILNPYLAKDLFARIGFHEPLFNEEHLIEAYQRRLKSFKDPRSYL